MRGDDTILELLNEVLTAELTAVNQYFLEAKMQDNWGFKRLAAHVRAESIDEMKHADVLIERILYLEGHPNLQRLGPVGVGQTVKEQFELDLELEREAIDRLNKGIERCRVTGDHGSDELLRQILVSEEEHADWIETQLFAMDTLGEAEYLSQQLHEGD